MNRSADENNSKKDSDKMEKFRILFVCTGNSCRSPMAEGILKSIIPETYRDKVEVTSAGTGGFVNMPATDLAIKVAAENGVDIKNHLSQGLTLPMMMNSDLIFVMAEVHAKYIRLLYPSLVKNVFLLKDFNCEKKLFHRSSIADPIGRNEEFYKKNYKEIESELHRVLTEIIKLVNFRLTDAG